MENNEGNLDQFNLLLGQQPTQEQPQQQQQPIKPQQQFPWGKDWLSIHNDFLFDDCD